MPDGDTDRTETATAKKRQDARKKGQVVVSQDLNRAFQMMIVLIVFGPRRLPEISRSMGKALREFKRGMNEIQRELEVAERETKWSETSSRTPPGSTAGPNVSTSPNKRYLHMI